ncbi:hypothetical protein CWC52_14250 (plasmid) [Enterococcus faecium]|nr:hypothetical protein CWC52_14250 [Enterococcus faecium]
MKPPYVTDYIISVVTKYHKGRHSLFLYNLEIFCAFTQDILRSPKPLLLVKMIVVSVVIQAHK